VNNPRISAGQPTNLLASLNGLTHFIEKAKGFKKEAGYRSFCLTGGVIPTHQ
jgi:hypothetical protein